jgi:hypothetical protein
MSRSSHLSPFVPHTSAIRKAPPTSQRGCGLASQKGLHLIKSLVGNQLEPVGNISAGRFHKTITDYIIRNVNTGTIGNGNDIATATTTAATLDSPA